MIDSQRGKGASITVYGGGDEVEEEIEMSRKWRAHFRKVRTTLALFGLNSRLTPRNRPSAVS